MNGRGYGGRGPRRGGFGGRGRSFGGPRFDRFSDEPKPVNVGEEYDVEISEVGSRGDGIARVKNFVVFVADSKQNEKVRIKIKEVRERFAIGEKIGPAQGEVASSEKTEATTEAPAETEVEAVVAASEKTESETEEAKEETEEEEDEE
jgi:predicted RNA-binding protein with TRAM domain